MQKLYLIWPKTLDNGDITYTITISQDDVKNDYEVQHIGDTLLYHSEEGLVILEDVFPKPIIEEILAGKEVTAATTALIY